jgi:hypothetical protein
MHLQGRRLMAADGVQRRRRGDPILWRPSTIDPARPRVVEDHGRQQGEADREYRATR